MKSKALISIYLTVIFLFSLANVFAAGENSSLLGDVNGDGDIDAYDYILVKRYHFNTVTLNESQLLAADVNNDKAVNEYDYILLKRHHFGTYKIQGEVESEPESEIPENAIVVSLTADSRDSEDMEANTKVLQECIDRANANGGGTVYIPKGDYYFASQGLNGRKYNEYVCMPKDNVTVIGAGKETVLYPVGRTTNGLDMFYFNEYADSGFTNPQYLINADFRDFVINGALANADNYTSAGKGFMINLYKDCDWRNVIVKNTDGTGFGMDCPINCTIIDCEAYNCGKLATTSDVGASGFGIGTGYSEEETILIENCYAEGNKKFGIFFEHQGRFCGGKNYKARNMKSFVVNNCTAKNNYVDFGGELAVDVTYRNCYVPADSTSVANISFTHHSIRCTVENMNVEARFDDATDESAYYYDAVYWAVNQGLTTGIGSNLFGINDTCTKAQAITFLYRLAGYPGELRLTNKAEVQFYENALTWAIKQGMLENGNTIDDKCSYNDLIYFMWVYDGSVEAEGEYDSATNWAIENGIIAEITDGTIIRCDTVNMLYKYFGEK